jgi:hypothetical protein
MPPDIYQDKFKR